MSEISYICYIKSASSKDQPGILLNGCVCGHRFLVGTYGCPHCGREAVAGSEKVETGPFTVRRSIKVMAPLAPWPPAPFIVAEIELASDLTGLAVISDAHEAVAAGTRVVVGNVSNGFPLFEQVPEMAA